jgi:2-polyprenyl-3-methyl-5-hydroxy-6-metoxy-1,4-benzoquinol methylase
MNRPGHAAGAYVFGSSAAEITRLQELGELLQHSTRQALQEAGIAEGMNVLDIGCGPGSVTFLAAELVGRAGSVTGVDRDPAMLATARADALSSRQSNVSFIRADLAELSAEGWLEAGFDAIVGRLILLHLDDPVAVLRRLMPHLHPGGVVVFSEPDLIRMGASFPPIPVLDQLCEWVRDAHRALGIDCQFGLRLQQVFQDAGLPAPRLKCEAFIGSGADWGWYDQMLQAARNAMPVVLSSSITTAEQAGLDTLAERIREAAASQRSVTRAIDLVSAWTRTAPAHQ